VSACASLRHGTITPRLVACMLAVAGSALAGPAGTSDSQAARAEGTSPVEGPSSRAASNLLLDLRKIVELQEITGWKIDRYEFEAMMPNALVSVCGAAGSVRVEALARSRDEVGRRGGPLEVALAANGGRLDGLEPLLVAVRVEGLLRRAIERAPEDCPSWIAPAEAFEAIQSPVDRWMLVAEGGGQGTVQLAFDRDDGGASATLGGGGGGRLLAGRAFGETWSLRFGPDVSAKALVQRSGATTTLPLQFQFGVPIVVRRTQTSWFSSAELAPLALVAEDDPRVRGGVRAGFMVGRSTLRVRSVVPWAGLGVEVEVFPSPDERPTLVNVKGGLRAGVDWLL
jgi:hypothetical protein